MKLKDSIKLIPNSSSPSTNQSKLNIILNGDRLLGFNELDNTPGNLNKAVLQLEENIKVEHENTLMVSKEVDSINAMIGDFSDSDEHYIRYKNTWVPVKEDGSQLQLNYGSFKVERIEQDRLIPTKQHVGNIKQPSKSTLSMGTSGVYKIDIYGTIPEVTGVVPTELVININGVPQDEIKIGKMGERSYSVFGYSVVPVLLTTDIIHITMKNSLGITFTQDDISLKLTIQKIGDLNHG